MYVPQWRLVGDFIPTCRSELSILSWTSKWISFKLLILCNIFKTKIRNFWLDFLRNSYFAYIFHFKNSRFLLQKSQTFHHKRVNLHSLLPYQIPHCLANPQVLQNILWPRKSLLIPKSNSFTIAQNRLRHICTYAEKVDIEWASIDRWKTSR